MFSAEVSNAAQLRFLSPILRSLRLFSVRHPFIHISSFRPSHPNYSSISSTISPLAALLSHTSLIRPLQSLSSLVSGGRLSHLGVLTDNPLILLLCNLHGRGRDAFFTHTHEQSSSPSPPFCSPSLFVFRNITAHRGTESGNGIVHLLEILPLILKKHLKKCDGIYGHFNLTFSNFSFCEATL